MLLKPHPQTLPSAVQSIDATCWREGDRWHFHYLVDGTSQLLLSDPAAPDRADGLWQTTCFEAFVGERDGAYLEFNFAPSGLWAAYAFDGPREVMREMDAQVEVWLEGGDDWIAVEAAVHCTGFMPDSPLGLSAVIEEDTGHKGYWALAHPDGPPDFHNSSCFVARLPE